MIPQYNTNPSLAAGARLGRYEIVSLLGVGGMGEVYRARDTSLDRDVAIKLLPAAFAADAERVGRFQREAKVVCHRPNGLVGGPRRDGDAGPHQSDA